MGRKDIKEVPTESTEQQWLIQWAQAMSGAHPELRMLYHVPNEGKRSRVTGARMRAEGLRKGVPDLCLPVARDGYHGLYIELKRQKGGKLSEDQRWWIDRLAAEKYMVAVCYGFEAASQMILDYLGGCV